jgi:hypothetical protein
MVDKEKGVGRVPPTLSTQADFSTMMECTPESGCCHSVYSLVFLPQTIYQKGFEVHSERNMKHLNSACVQ